MDDAVRRAMAKWPDVPSVFGWLALDSRGRWLIRNERISHCLLIDFIGRNYACDHDGRWFFQNGPQRVFVTLAYAPWVLRMQSQQALVTHTGRPTRSVRGAWMDRAGVVVLDTEHGAGVVDDRDLEALGSAITDAAGATLDEDRLIESLDDIQDGKDRSLWLNYAGAAVPLLPIDRDEVPTRLHFVRDPRALAGEQAGD